MRELALLRPLKLPASDDAADLGTLIGCSGERVCSGDRAFRWWGREGEAESLFLVGIPCGDEGSMFPGRAVPRRRGESFSDATLDEGAICCGEMKRDGDPWRR